MISAPSGVVPGEPLRLWAFRFLPASATTSARCRGRDGGNRFDLDRRLSSPGRPVLADHPLDGHPARLALRQTGGDSGGLSGGPALPVLSGTDVVGEDRHPASENQWRGPHK